VGTPRTATLRVAAALLALLVMGTLVLLAHPVLLTGRYYEMSIQSVEFEPGGMVSITYDDVITYGTSVLWAYGVTRNGRASMVISWESGPRSFLRWPRRDHRTFGFYLTTEEERAKGVGDSPAIRQRLLLKEGTYRVRPGEPLVATRIASPDGTPIESMLEVTPTP